MTTTSQALSFDGAASRYAAHRPSYPPALFDAVEELAGRPLRGADVADIGAGTGLATRHLHARGARVVAVEPGAAMAGQFLLGPTRAFLAEERDRLLEVFPHGTVEERYVASLAVAVH